MNIAGRPKSTYVKINWGYCRFASKDCKGKMEYRDHLGGESLCEYHASIEEKKLEGQQ